MSKTTVVAGFKIKMERVYSAVFNPNTPSKNQYRNSKKIRHKFVSADADLRLQRRTCKHSGNCVEYTLRGLLRGIHYTFQLVKFDQCFSFCLQLVVFITLQGFAWLLVSKLLLRLFSRYFAAPKVEEG